MKSALPLLAAAVILPLPGLFAAASPAALPGPVPHPLASAPDPSGKPEEVSFSTEDKVKLTGSYYAPRKKGRAHAVLLVHDAGTDRRQLDQLGADLQRAGFAVLSFDLRGHGQSVGGDYDWAKLDQEGRARTWVFTQRDLGGAAEYLRGREDVHTSSLTLIGHRSGGGAAVRYAASDLNVRAVVVLDPVQDELGFNLTKDLVALEELQTMLIAPKEGRQDTERLVNAGHSATGGGREWIRPCILKSDSPGLLVDKRLAREVSDWLREILLPSKE